MELIQIYDEILGQHKAVWNGLKTRYNLISAIRLFLTLLFCACLYFYLKTDNQPLFYGMIVTIPAFAACMVIHQKLAWKKNLKQTLIQINEAELTYLNQQGIPFEHGADFNNPTHAYSNDLDIFGPHSLFQHLNRTATYMGQAAFSELLLSLLPPETIKANQEAVQELTPKINWRQEVQAVGKMTADDKKIYEKLVQWSISPLDKMHWLLKTAAFALPAILLTLIVLYIITKNTDFSDLAFKLFPVNLLILLSQAKKIRAENIAADKVHDIIKKYGILLEKIEQEQFNSTQLKELKNKLYSTNGTASREIKRLSVLFSNSATSSVIISPTA